MSNVDKVKLIYEAFGRGDVETILAQISEDVDWEYGATPSDVPWMQPSRGHGGAVGFFSSLAGMEINSFAITEYLVSGDLVIALMNIDFIVKATGLRVAEENEVHIWRFNSQGKVSRIRHRADTLAHQRAIEG